MKSIRELYKIGRGPSSSHTMGPERAARRFLDMADGAERYTAVLYGSLALTGKGHMTDVAIRKTFEGRSLEIIFDTEKRDLPHANTLDFFAHFKDKPTVSARYLSVGGGDIREAGEAPKEVDELYPEKSFAEIAAYCQARNMRLSSYVYEHEDEAFKGFLQSVLSAMREEIDCGLKASGTLPGGLGVERVAQLLFNRRHMDESPQTRENRIVCAYAFAAAEHNADCGTVVTAPTCGSCGVLPAVLRYVQQKRCWTRLP